MTELPRPPDATVPCGSCTICCKGPTVYVMTEFGDDPTKLSVVHVSRNMITGRPGLALDHGPDGKTCIHLVDDKCSVYEHRPVICRTYDCRKLAALPGRVRRAQVEKHPDMAPIFARGNELLKGGS